jgi:hypothetical protein
MIGGTRKERLPFAVKLPPGTFFESNCLENNAGNIFFAGDRL